MVLKKVKIGSSGRYKCEVGTVLKNFAVFEIKKCEVGTILKNFAVFEIKKCGLGDVEKGLPLLLWPSI